MKHIYNVELGPIFEVRILKRFRKKNCLSIALDIRWQKNDITFHVDIKIVLSQMARVISVIIYFIMPADFNF